ncbi:MAG: DUF1592 domain-containing protein [Nannocystaceae bacterium]|nr:DUF1592 domain-containing protein [Nannocystaceae bacterium]
MRNRSGWEHAITIGAVSWLLAGCYAGAAEDTDGQDTDAQDTDARPGPDDPPEDPFCDGDALPGQLTRFARLTHRQYDNSVRDLLGDDTHPSAAFLGDPAVGGFTNNADQLTVSDRLARDYRRAAEAISADLVAEPTRLASLVGCADSDACAREFVGSFGRRAFRRPLTETQTEQFMQLYAAGDGLYESGSPFEQGIAIVVEGFLQSPSFLYRVELSAPQADQPTVALDDFEIASRLSYMLWNSVPDDELLDAAQAGELSEPQGVEMHARRLLEDPRAIDPVEDFHDQWLKLSHIEDLAKDPDAFPMFDNEVASSMREETLQFVRSVVYENDGSFADLLTSTSTFANDDLAAIYGLEGSFGETLQPVELDPARRAGFLTQPGFLAANAYFAETSPIHRGVFVQRQLMCTVIPDPPGDADLDLPASEGELVTTRDRVTAHTSPDYCAACHTLINDPGFAFEGYDAIGRERLEENGEMVNTAGVLLASGEQIEFTDAVDMAHQIADSEVARRCYLRQWFRYASARSEGAEDTCTLEGLDTSLADSDYNVRELLVALTQTASFRYRNVEGQ